MCAASVSLRTCTQQAVQILSELSDGERVVVVSRHNSLTQMEDTRQRNTIIVTGLPGTGKSVVAERLANEHHGLLVNCDSHRYGENWSKKPFLVYHDAIMRQLSQGGLKVIEGSYYDAHDAEHARMRVFNELVQTYPTQVQVFMIKSPKDVTSLVAALIDRSVRRATGAESSGTCPESSMARAKLVMKNIRNFEANCNYLEAFRELCKRSGVPVQMLSFWMDDNGPKA